MLKNTIALTILIWSLNASAELTGSWLGFGEWNYDGSGTHCSIVQMVFSEDGQTLTRESGKVECDYVAMDYPTLVLTKKGSELWLDNQIIGKLSSDTYSWVEDYNGSTKIQVTVQRQGNALTYSEKWIDGKSQPLYDISARLFTQ